MTTYIKQLGAADELFVSSIILNKRKFRSASAA